MKIGAQFFTIRDFCRDLNGLDESMKKVADIGYKHIQLSGVCAYEADWMAERLKAYGLEANITHYNYDKIIHETDETIAFHDTMGCKYIGIGGNPRGINPEGLSVMASEVKPIVGKLIASGHKFMYHNHHYEFARFDGKTFIELLCETFTPEECGVTLDTYWAQAGGADPAQWLRRLDGRVNCVHFKDMVFSQADGAVRMAAIGDGNINFEPVIRAAEEVGTEYLLVEQDLCHGEDPFECLARSYRNLRALGLD